MTDQQLPPKKPSPAWHPETPGKMVERPIRGFERVWFIRHSLIQMKLRSITEDDVLRAIARPSKTGLPTQPNRKRVRWVKARSMSVDVVYEEWESILVVVTAIKIKS
jgi:hypothetical protein